MQLAETPLMEAVGHWQGLGKADVTLEEEQRLEAVMELLVKAGADLDHTAMVSAQWCKQWCTNTHQYVTFAVFVCWWCVAGAVRDVGRRGLIQLQACRNSGQDVARQGMAKQGRRAASRWLWSRSLINAAVLRYLAAVESRLLVVCACWCMSSACARS